MNIKSGFEKARLYIESKQNDPSKLQKQGFCITISREPGAGSDLVSEEIINLIQERFNQQWAIFDKNLIEKIIADNNLSLRLLDYFNKEHHSVMDNFVNELLGLQPSESQIIKAVSKTILQIATLGYAVIVGRGSNFVTAKMENTFHIRLVANYNDRVKHIQEHYQFNKKQAEEFIAKEDKSRAEFVKKYFHKDINDPQNYHIIFNTSNIKHVDIAEIIVNYISKRYTKYFN